MALKDDKARLRFPDGLRGLAALAVIGPHLLALYCSPKAGAAARVLRVASDYGRYGVQVFFVISGFVIAYTLRDVRMRPSDATQFIARRAVRLDPPYWVGLVLSLLYLLVHARFAHAPTEHPTASQLVAHLFYLQEILAYPEINVTYWTLCIEFQFYFGFAMLLTAAQAVARRTGTDPRRMSAAVGTVAFAVSLAWASGGLHVLGNPRMFVFPHLAGFLGGAVCLWAIEGLLPRPVWTLALLGLGLCEVLAPSPSTLVEWATMLALLAAARGRGMSRWLAAPLFQYLGRISYPIYLVQAPIALVLIGLRTRMAPDSDAAAFTAHAIIVVAAVLVAHVLHVFVERPCIRLSKRLKTTHRLATGSTAPIVAAAATRSASS